MIMPQFENKKHISGKQASDAIFVLGDRIPWDIEQVYVYNGTKLVAGQKERERENGDNHMWFEWLICIIYAFEMSIKRDYKKKSNYLLNGLDKFLKKH